MTRRQSLRYPDTPLLRHVRYSHTLLSYALASTDIRPLSYAMSDAHVPDDTPSLRHVRYSHTLSPYALAGTSARRSA
eukprot:457941-Rhodomonas_salina.1